MVVVVNVWACFDWVVLQRVQRPLFLFSVLCELQRNGLALEEAKVQALTGYRARFVE